VTWRDLESGVDPLLLFLDMTWADGATDQPGIPAQPVYTRIDGGSAGVLPWWEGVEEPNWPTGLGSSPNPTYPNEDVGARPIAGAYEPAFRTDGPVRAWGHEPSGGYHGDQAYGRIMRFPANVPDRYDPNGVWNTDYKDEMAQAVKYNDVPYVTDAEITTNLLLWPQVEG
jgi:hypothetical protein